MSSLDLQFLVGHSIKSISQEERDDNADHYILTLDDGTQYLIDTNEGCGACYNGWSEISGLEDLPTDNVITNVDTIESSTDDNKYQIFVFFHDKRYDIAVNDGYGNGYYGGGFNLTISELDE